MEFMMRFYEIVQTNKALNVLTPCIAIAWIVLLSLYPAFTSEYVQQFTKQPGEKRVRRIM